MAEANIANDAEAARRVFTAGFKHIFWSVIVCVAMGCAAIFLYYNTIDYMNATVVTTLDTLTVPLSEVFFPSVVVCNINQVRDCTPVQWDS